jgi:hypothetical protein
LQLLLALDQRPDGALESREVEGVLAQYPVYALGCAVFLVR